MGQALEIKSIAAAAMPQVESILTHYLPRGKQSGREYQCADLTGGNGDSCSFNTTTGQWADFATGEKGGDVVSLIAAIRKCNQFEAAKELADFIGHATTSATPLKAVKSEVWAAIVPVPTDAPAPPAKHYQHGAPVSISVYRNRAGQVNQYEHRYESPADNPADKNKKQFSPLTFCRNESTGKTEWRFQAIPADRPLYGLEFLTNTTKAALVAEGGKATDAARRIVGDKMPVITWSGGSNAVDKTDWTQVKGLRLCVWPDADAPGYKAALLVADAAMKAGAVLVKIVVPPAGVVEGFDLADAESAGWTPKQVMQSLTASVSPEEFKAAVMLAPQPSQDAPQEVTVCEPIAPAPTTLFENAADFLNETIKVDYLIHKLFELFTLVSITGPSGQYKSFVAVCIACCVATGRPWNGRTTKQGAVLYLAGEGRPGIKRRVIAWCIANGLKPADLTGFYLSRNTLLMDGSNTDQIVSEMAGIDVALIIVDTTARHLAGHENDTRDMGHYINVVDALKGQLGAAAIMVHHTGHDQTRGRGNTSYKAALDCEVMCDKGALTFSKMKDCEPPEPIEFKLSQVVIGEDDETGEPITSCVVEYGEKSFTNRQPAKAKTTAAERNVLGIISDTPGISIDDVRAEYYRRVLSLTPDAKPNTLHTAFRRAMEGLNEKGLAFIDGAIVLSGQRTVSGHLSSLSTHTSGQDRTLLLRECPSVQYAEVNEGVETFGDDEFLFDERCSP